MRIYFFSETPCALFSSGLMLGRVDGFERSFEAELSDSLFLEIVSPYDSVGFFLNRALLENPPSYLTVYVGDVIAIEYTQPYYHTLAILQQIEEENVYTLFLQDGLFLSIEGENYHLVSLPLYLKNAKMKVDEYIFLSSDDGIAKLSKDGIILFSYPLQRGKLYDLIGRELNVLEDGSLKFVDPTFSQDQIVFAFLEAVRIHEDLSPYLTNALYERKDELIAFLSGFSKVIPYQGGVALLFPKKENVYKIKPVSVEYKDGKIDNVKY